MIRELRVRGLATVADVTLDLAPGLNVLTGETGAGKSMLVDALALLLGGRADPGATRPGASRAIVEGVIELTTSAARHLAEHLGIDTEEGVLVVRREVAAEGRSRAWVNGGPVAAGVLARLGAHLVDLHGQHQTESLQAVSTQRALLDAFAGAHEAAAEVRAAWLAVEAIRHEEAGLMARREEAGRKADYLRHVVREIDAARPVAGEEERLAAEARRLGQAGALSEHAARVRQSVDDGERALTAAGRALGALERLDPAAGPWRELLDTALANLDELDRELQAYASTAEEDPDRLAAVETRRDQLAALQRKYGETIAQVLATREAAAGELDLLDSAVLDLRSLGARRAAAEQAHREAADRLGARRRDGAEKLARGVNRWLPRLGLAGGRFEVALTPVAAPGATGAEEVEFQVRLNVGMDQRPLAKVASGGELSRLMLALKVLLARHHDVPTLVFDEIDQGIGGEVGAQVGAALTEVAEGRQVLVITHLPQIAARADRHLVVAKRARGGIATSDVQVVHGEDRVTELARMLGDADAETARRHAMTLLAAVSGDR